MAKCPICHQIWHCSGEGAEYWYDPDEEMDHCRKCRCKDCRLDRNRIITKATWLGKGNK